MNELALFAGAGGGILGGKLLGWRTVCAVEIDPYARGILLQRQADGILERFPIWDDIRTFRGEQWRGAVDIVTGGFPCTDLATCGLKRGITGPESSLWGSMARIIGEARPPLVLIENSPSLVTHGLDVVLGSLAEMGFDAEWGVIGANSLGGPIVRERAWILGAHRERLLRGTESQRELTQERKGEGSLLIGPVASRADRWEPFPGVPRMAGRVAHRVDRQRCAGNAQVPIVAAAAYQVLRSRLTEN